MISDDTLHFQIYVNYIYDTIYNIHYSYSYISGRRFNLHITKFQPQFYCVPCLLTCHEEDFKVFGARKMRIEVHNLRVEKKL